MSIELVHVGFNNIIVMNGVIAIASPNSAPTKRTVQESKNKGLLIDLTNGRRTKAVIINDSGHVFAGTDMGAFRSKDNGDKWSEINNGLPNDYVYTLAINNSGHIFAGIADNGIRNMEVDDDD